MSTLAARSGPAGWVLELLACPDCGADLPTSGFACSCGFHAVQSTRLDLRPRAPAPRQLRMVPETQAIELLSRIPIDRPNISYRSPPGCRDSSELFSALGPAARPGARLLDLGCGPRDQERCAREFGMQYCGADYSSGAADMLVDAHALPFRRASFDVVFSYAVLEHLHSPALALQEIVRVLVPGGCYVATVSQGEPFHDSFYHHTSWGLLHGLSAAGLEPLRIWPAGDTLGALASMGRYPRMVRIMIAMLDSVQRRLPMLAPRKYFRWSQRERELDELHRSSAICFLARKPST